MWVKEEEGGKLLKFELIVCMLLIWWVAEWEEDTDVWWIGVVVGINDGEYCKLWLLWGWVIDLDLGWEN